MKQQVQPGTLFVVATPLGNLEDTSARALSTLQAVDIVACEDTRHTRKLLSHFEISTKTLSYHDHNARERCGKLVTLLQQGQSIALVSDAGTPGVSDPAYRLVRECHLKKLRVVPIPGPSAATAAVSVCGLPSNMFLFVGFLPRKIGPRKSKLVSLSKLACTLIFFLPPHRLSVQLAEIEKAFGDRPAFLAREMTKIHESFSGGTVREIQSAIEDAPLKGECTLIVTGAVNSDASSQSKVDVAAYVAGLQRLRGLSRSEAIRQTAVDLQKPKNAVYRAIVDRNRA